MNLEGQENQGTGLRDVYDILVKAPPERLRSLTIQLGESPEDNIIHALCLIVLRREEQALNKLQMLTDNHLANHLVEMWKMSGGKLEDFAVHCNSQQFTGESLAALARIFKVLSEQRLCDQLLRNLAYKRALSTNSQKTSNCEDREYDQFIEEAKVVCGPQFAEWMCSFRDLKLGSSHDPHSSPDEGNTTLKVVLSQYQSKSGMPSPLQASSSLPSYPTHLEISIPPTATFQEDKITPETPGSQQSIVVVNEVKNAPEESKIKSNEPPLFKDTKMDAAFAAVCNQKESPNQTTEPKFSLPTATSISPPKMTLPNKMYESKGAEEEEEEEVFYAFVILHAQEDAEVAEKIKEKLETIIGREGATFSEDFAIPGKSTLRCIGDAINNSAFTLLLLTRNFNTRLLEMKTDSALINSINYKHKYNTVIPLLPMENRMPKQSIPIVLQTLVPLDEKKSFDKKTQKTLSKAKIDKQKRIWMDEQRVKIQIERQEALKRSNQNQKQFIQECKAAQLLEQETLSLLMARDCNFVSPSARQQHPSIQITNAKYIMIGNDSQMTVDYGGGAEKDDAIQSDEEQ
ncbi:TIR domain-containing adapter molecule 1 [Thunnus thynnus]|uniref:TIR domain-containing adapter molecule 1 n=1 Tax=Thunnus thynnus TaxID=8237 RepID=UPI003529B1E8